MYTEIRMCSTGSRLGKTNRPLAPLTPPGLKRMKGVYVYLRTPIKVEQGPSSRCSSCQAEQRGVLITNAVYQGTRTPHAPPLLVEAHRPQPQPQPQPTQSSSRPRAPSAVANGDRRAAPASRRGLLMLTIGGAAGWATGLRPQELRAQAAEGITTVFVAGASGNTGRRIVQQLREAGFAVRAGVRSTSKALSLGFGADPGIQIVEADVTKGVDVLAAAIGKAQAVICATGAVGFGANGAAAVDEQGTISLVDAALRSGAVTKFVLVSSLLTNAQAVGQGANPNYVFLNLFGGVLDRKLRAEKYLRASGLNYTIIRPGGLSNEPESAVGNLIVSREDTLFALDSDPARVISRDTVAAVAVQALLQPDTSSNRVLEVVASPTAPRLSSDQWFSL